MSKVNFDEVKVITEVETLCQSLHNKLTVSRVMEDSDLSDHEEEPIVLDRSDITLFKFDQAAEEKNLTS